MTIVHVKQLHTSRYQLAYMLSKWGYPVQLLTANLFPIGREEGVLKGVLRRYSKRPMFGLRCNIRVH